MYIKLGKFQSALHDGCEIIKRKPGMAMVSHVSFIFLVGNVLT